MLVSFFGTALSAVRSLNRKKEIVVCSVVLEASHVRPFSWIEVAVSEKRKAEQGSGGNGYRRATLGRSATIY